MNELSTLHVMRNDLDQRIKEIASWRNKAQNLLDELELHIEQTHNDTNELKRDRAALDHAIKALEV